MSRLVAAVGYTRRDALVVQSSFVAMRDRSIASAAAIAVDG
jgi:hypothetical protein